MKKYILAGILLGATILQAKQWYIPDGDALKCNKSEYSPFDFKDSFGGLVREEKDGIYTYATSKGGDKIWFTTSIAKCNWILSKVKVHKK